MDFKILGHQLLNTAVFSLLGIIVLAMAFWLWEKMTPYSIANEITEKQNSAVAIVMAGVLIGVAIIVAAAVTG